MQFFRAEYLAYLWAIPAVLLVHFFSMRLWESRMKRFAERSMLEGKLIPRYKKSHWMSRALLIALVFLFSILALARPQWGEEK
ncbi:MAG: hypothetical protein FGM27_09350, partial [Candidatus Omnitrophica bacterium]|nr:hypothetical protein [Candidatus Omnitrophota bacterium]